jgi:two-component system, cell cycle response regulator DivK
MKEILVVEDNSVNRELIREILESRGYSVTEAENGEEALASLRKQIPTVAIIDIQMPRLSGIDLIKSIRGDSSLARTKCLALTAYAMSGDREKVLEAGFDAYLTKPFESKELLAAINGLI